MAAKTTSRDPYRAGQRITWTQDGQERTGEIWSAGPGSVPGTVWTIPDQPLAGEATAVLVRVHRSGRKAGTASGEPVRTSVYGSRDTDLGLLSSEAYQHALAAAYRQAWAEPQTMWSGPAGIHQRAQTLALDILLADQRAREAATSEGKPAACEGADATVTSAVPAQREDPMKHQPAAYLHHTEDRELTTSELTAERKADQGAMRARCSCGYVTSEIGSYPFVNFVIKEHSRKEGKPEACEAPDMTVASAVQASQPPATGGPEMATETTSTKTAKTMTSSEIDGVTRWTCSVHGLLATDDVAQRKDRTKCRPCERDYHAAKRGTASGEPRAPRAPRQPRATRTPVVAAGPNREAALLMVEALDVIKNALAADGSTRKGETPLAHANRIAGARRAALEVVGTILGDAVEQSQLAGLLDTVAPVAAAQGAA